MNCTYRLVWSTARNAMIAVAETSKGRGKSSGRNKSVALTAVATGALLLMAGEQAAAADQTISTALTSQYTIANGDSLTISPAGSVSTSGGLSGAGNVKLNSGSTAGFITNQGSVYGGTGGLQIDAGGVTGSIMNAGFIGGINYGMVVSNGPVGGDILNTGTIQGLGGFWALRVENSTVSGAIRNEGQITGSASLGIAISVGNNATVVGGITNAGTLSSITDSVLIDQSHVSAVGTAPAVHNTGSMNTGITVRNGSTVDGTVANDGDAAYVAMYTNSVLNGRLINAGSLTRGVSFTDNALVTQGISNSGFMGADSSSASFIVDSGATVVGGITNSGTISGSTGIRLGTGSLVQGGITNSGTIQSLAASSSWAGIVLWSGATVSGGITNSGLIDGGSSAAGIRITSGSLVEGGVTNTGTIQGGDGIRVSNGGTLAGGIHNAASGSINALSGSPNSAAVLVEGGGLVNGLTNAGTLHGQRYGIHVLGGSTVTEGISNSGLIQSDSNFGIAVEDTSTVSGGIVNAGTILGDHGGINIKDNSVLSGGIRNTGLIETNRSAGISVLSGSSVAGGITNSGTISVDTTEYDIGGISVEHATVSGGITNSGLINVVTSSEWDYGIYLNNAQVDGSIVNTGTITATAPSTSHAFGIGLDGGSVSGGITNSGLIHAGSTHTSTGYGAHFEGSSTLTGSIVNTGTIIGEGVDDAYGVYVESSAIGGLTNSGLIEGRYQSGTGVKFTGAASVTGAVLNQAGGTILGGGDGIFVASAALAGGVTNSGHITGTTGIGIDVSGTSTIDGGIHNLAGGTISGGDAGIHVDASATVNGTINNAGLITGTNYALSLQNSASPLTVDNTGTLQGDVDLGGAGNILNLNGASGRVIGAVTSTGPSGTVNVNGTFSSEGLFSVETFNVTNGGLFNMNNDIGALAATLQSGGKLSVGTATRSFSGNYSQASGGIFSISLVDAASNYGKLHVGGNATVANGAIVDVNVVGAPVIADGAIVQGVIAATGTLTANAANITVTDNSALYNFTASTARNAQELDLVTTADPNGITNAVVSNSNPAAMGAAGALQVMANTGIPTAMQPVFDRLGTMSEAQVSDAVSQMLPAITGAAPQAGINALHSMNKVIQSRVESNHGLSSGNKAADQYMWVRAFGNHGDQDDRNGVSGFDSDTGGLVVGVDAPLTDKVRAGGAFTYAKSTITGNSDTAPSKAKVDTYELVGYASYNINAQTDINYQLDFGKNRAESVRRISFMGTTASAKFDSLAIHGSAGIGHTLSVNSSTNVTPSVRLDYTEMRTDGYTETGAGPLNLNVDDSTYREFLLTADAKFSHQLSDTLKLVGNGSIGYDFVNKQVKTAASFTGGGPVFETNGMEVSPWVYRVGLGLIKDDQKGLEYSLRYDAEARTSGYLNQTLSARVRWAF